MSPSLGKKLKRVMERDSDANKSVDVHFKRDLEIVEGFYTEIKKNIAREINAGGPIRPIKISATGGYHDIFWVFHLPQAKPVALDRSDNAFRRQWDAFLRWSVDNDLKVELFYFTDVQVRHDYWFEIRIFPAV
jgi:hypothetical protein